MLHGHLLYKITQFGRVNLLTSQKTGFDTSIGWLGLAIGEWLLQATQKSFKKIRGPLGPN